MARTSKYKVSEVVNAVLECRGMTTYAARQLGCSPETIRRYRMKHKSVAKAFDEAKEAQIDRSEVALFRSIDSGDTTANIFYLKTQAKDRGYVEKKQIEILNKIPSAEDLAKLSKEELDELAAEVKARRKR
jgi:hypothetical protein